ncbi:PIG-L deacetylase family protein [Salinicola halimionae]|uniref:PIG-L deacetylase family protein n=1 Tax=Salinicola halimionae TaxID=1949081 RepID=UPI000DA19452|nr:PIG-L deacetylase family protein [Salinicola halimionae]
MNKVVLVVAAHSDDEALGCGGTIKKHSVDGDTVHAVFLADGVTSRPDKDAADLAQRNAASAEAQQILGIENVYMLGFPDQRMDGVSLLDIVQKLEKIIYEIKPEVIYTHHLGDLNLDHRITHQAVLTACRPVPEASVKEIYSFEVMSSSEWNAPTYEAFLPNVFIDISDFIGSKIESLQKYEVEMRDYPHSRSIAHIEYLARHRGAIVGVEAAEAFMAIRIMK